MAICTKIGVALVAGGLIISAAHAGVPAECTTPPIGAGDCFTETPGVGGCTDADCCESICGSVAECCTEEWGLDCTIAAGTNPLCELPNLCGEVALGGTVASPETCEDPFVDIDPGCAVDITAFVPYTLGTTASGNVIGDEVAGTRDADRYLFTVGATGQLNVSVSAEFNVLAILFQLPSGDCVEPAVGVIGFGGFTSDGGACPLEFGACVDPGLYYLRIAPLFPAVDLATPPDPLPPPLLLTCADASKDYTFTITLDTGSDACVGFPCPADSDIILTHNLSQDLVDGAVACVDGGPPQAASFNNFGRSYSIPAGGTFFVQCIEFGIEANTGVEADVTVSVFIDSSGGAPDLASLVLLGSETVTMAAGLDSQKLSATFAPALEVAGGSTLFVEYGWDANPDTAIFPGGNLDGQDAPTWILSDDGAGGACAITEWTDMADIGFPDQATIVNVHGTTKEPAGCTGDIAGPGGGPPDGVVNGFDLGTLLGQWTGAASYTPCPPIKSGDIAGPGGGPPDCKVNGFDLGTLLGNWGPC
jgi:hypothetical protein